MSRLIWWLRRDLRLEGNTALAAAIAKADEVIPVFVLDDRLLASPRVQGPRIAWMLDGLHALAAELRRYGSSLVVRRGSPASELLALCQESQADGVYFNRDYSPYATRRDQAVIQALTGTGFRVKTFKDAVLHEPGEVASMPVKSPIALAGEENARQRLASFIAGPIYRYAVQRNRPDMDGSAILSPYLRWGMISPRQCYRAAVQALETAPDEAGRLGVTTWIGELAWREFFAQLLANHPSSVNRNLRSVYDSLVWQNRQGWLDVWREGCTGYPIVDAAMRQMNATGWMHNRARLIAASFLCKDLLIDWRQGEIVFMQRLIDGDVASNVGNWQWVAGTGADAAPYFRVLNPVTQAEMFDPEGDYVRQWVPELAHVPGNLIHRPEKMTPKQQQQAGCILGRDYPAPIVDHAVQRRRALATYAASRANKR